MRMMRAIAGIDGVEFRSQRLPRNLAKRAGELNAGRAAANQDERQQPPLIDRVRFAFGLFEGQQQPPPDPQRIVEGLETRSSLRPVVVAEVCMRRARGDDQIVVCERLPTVELNFLGLESMCSTFASSTRTRFCLRRIHRIGDAMSPGESPAVAT